MSKSTNAVPRESGSQSLGKNHDKPAHPQGAHDRGKHEKAQKEQGRHDAGKPIVPVESTTHHSGRPHPPATKLADSKVLGGKLRKADNV